MSKGTVINVWYNRTTWPFRGNERIRELPVNDVPLTKDFMYALTHGVYCERHEYESVYGEFDPHYQEINWPEEMWRLLQADQASIEGRIFPLSQERSMCIGDVVTLSRVEDDFDEEKCSWLRASGVADDGGFTVHDIAAWIAVPVGFAPCPQFLKRLR